MANRRFTTERHCHVRCLALASGRADLIGMYAKLKIGRLHVSARLGHFAAGLAFNGVLLGLLLVGELSGLFHWLETTLH